MNLAQVSNLSDRGAGLLSIILRDEYLRVAEFRKDTSTHVHMKNTHASTGSAARAEGSGLQNDAQVPVVSTKTHALYSRSITVDQLRKLDSNLTGTHKGLIEFYDRRLAGLADALGKEIRSHMITGDLTSNKMLGLLDFVKDAASGGQTARLDFSTAELAAMNAQAAIRINDDAGMFALLEYLEEQIDEVPDANAIVMNKKLGARFTTFARKVGAAGETRDSFGRKLTTYNDIPIVRVPNTDIPNNQTDGSTADHTSLFITRFSETLGVCYSTNSGFTFEDFEHLETTPSGKAVLSIYPSLTVEQTDALRRVSRIRW